MTTSTSDSSAPGVADLPLHQQSSMLSTPSVAPSTAPVPGPLQTPTPTPTQSPFPQATTPFNAGSMPPTVLKVVPIPTVPSTPLAVPTAGTAPVAGSGVVNGNGPVAPSPAAIRGPSPNLNNSAVALTRLAQHAASPVPSVAITPIPLNTRKTPSNAPSVSKSESGSLPPSIASSANPTPQIPTASSTPSAPATPVQQSSPPKTSCAPPAKMLPGQAAMSVTSAYAEVSERCFGKVGRWIKKLKTMTSPVDYQLDRPSEIESASRKFLAMIKGLRDCIDYEWIEEEDTQATAEDSLFLFDVANAGRISGSSNDKLPTMQLPSSKKGKQSPLKERFKIHKLPEIKVDGQVVDSTVTFRTCLYCKVPIWNRGWTCSETLSAGWVAPNGHHCCSGCFTDGLVCSSRHTMVMVERYSMKTLMERYNEAVATYNTIMLPIRKQHGESLAVPHASLRLSSNGELVGEFSEAADPRPFIGRSETTVSYHLNLRNILDYPVVQCHHCRSKRPPWEIVACTNIMHVDACMKHGMNRTKSGYYFCASCLYSKYRERGLNAWGARAWECPACRKSCLCGQCTSGQTVNAKAYLTDLANKSSGKAASNDETPSTGKKRERKKRKVGEMAAEGQEESDQNDVDGTSEQNRRLPATEAPQLKASVPTVPMFAVPPARAPRGSQSATQSRGQSPLTMLSSMPGSISEASLPLNVTPQGWMTDMSVGRLITELQANYRRELERSESLQKEVDELRDMAMSNSSYQDLMRENLQLKFDLGSAKNEIARLNSRLRDLERLNEQASSTVVPNLKKIAKAIASQASILSKSLPVPESEMPPNPGAVGQ